MDHDARTGRGLKVLLADEDENALQATDAVLRDLGHQVSAYAISVGEAAERIANEDPDLAVVVVHDDDDHALDLIDEIGEYARGPVVALGGGDDADFVRRAAERGVYAFARGGSPEEVQGAIDIATRRHDEVARLSDQVDQLEGALERRGFIERAKGILMERHGIDERRAFAMLREHARARNRKLVDVARAVTEGHGLLPKGDAARGPGDHAGPVGTP